jgi:hypothetical protein
MICRFFGYLKSEHTICPEFPTAAIIEENDDIKEYKKEVDYDKGCNKCLHKLLYRDERKD